MQNLSSAPNALWHSIETVYTIVNEETNWMESVEYLEEDLKVISQFFGCDQQEALIISILFMLHYREESTSVSNILGVLKLNISSSFHIHSKLEFFAKKQWVSPDRDKRLMPGCMYTIAPQMLKAVYTMDQQFLIEKPILNQDDLLVQITRKLKERENRAITYDAVRTWCTGMIESFPSFPIHSLLAELSMSEDEVLIFYYMLSKLTKNITTTDLDQVISDMNPPLETILRLRNIFESESTSLLTNGLVEAKTSMFSNEPMIRLSPKVLQCFLKTFSSQGEKIQSPFIQLIRPESLTEKMLIYTPVVDAQIQKLDRILSPEFHKQCEEKLVQLGKSTGISIMLHGYPGTGKTESVKQLAKKHQREIFFVEVSNIRDKYVGETEKNLKKVFDLYKEKYKNSEIAPILLFNEADALFGKRRVVATHLDQFENTIQNILLQELENFEGIFIATTNLIDNLDHAFDRRFLYKIAFEKPQVDTVERLWQEKFPELDTALVKQLSERWILTGGQIENIRKRYDIELIIEDDLLLGWSYLSAQCEQESSIQTKHSKERNPIGFKVTL